MDSEIKNVGVVVSLQQDLGSGYIKDVVTGRLYGISRKFIGEDQWNLLKEQAHVLFTDNGKGCVIELERLK